MVFAPNTKAELVAAKDAWLAGTITSSSSVPNGQGTGTYGVMNNWIVTGPVGARITDMSNMFTAANTFNEPIGDWDVSNVTNMSNMFHNNQIFNQPIGTWDVSNVTHMSTMFRNSVFNQDLSGWERQNGVNGATSTSTMANMIELNNFNRENYYFVNLSIRVWKISSSCNLSRFSQSAWSFITKYFGYPGYNSDQNTPSYTFFNQNPATSSLEIGYDSPSVGEATVNGITFAGGGSNYSGSIVIQDTVVNGGNTYNVTNIDSNAFDGYVNLTSVSIPHMVSAIGAEAFTNCTSLDTVIYKHHTATPTISFGSDVFASSTPLTYLGIYQSPTTLGGTVYTVGNTNATFSGGTFANVVLESNICFPAGTILSLDQGDIEIQNVDTKIHTLNGKPILFVTKTKPSKSDMVCFEKDAFAPNVPSQTVETSRAHIIEYNGERKMAEDWVDADQIHFVPNTHKILYNLLLETHEMMTVYNLQAETLNPVRKLAHMYFAQLRKEKETC
jgi:surface protein